MKNEANPRRDVDADWDVRAIQSAIDAARQVVGDGINGRSMISSLNELEWGWICSAAIFAWIKTKAIHATADGGGYDVAIRSMIGRVPPPWEAGAVSSILPSLASVDGVDWGKPIGEWSKDEIILFAWQIHTLVKAAMLARDAGAKDKLTSQAETERELSASNGGPLLARGELNDADIPF